MRASAIQVIDITEPGKLAQPPNLGQGTLLSVVEKLVTQSQLLDDSAHYFWRECMLGNENHRAIDFNLEENARLSIRDIFLVLGNQ